MERNSEGQARKGYNGNIQNESFGFRAASI
jgi:hypothetical protein